MLGVTCVLCVNLVTPALASRVPEGGDAFWEEASTIADSIKMTKSDAYTWVIGELQRISVEATSAMDSTSQPNVSKIMGLYGAYLAYLNWAVSNVSYNSSTNQWTVLQGPGDFDTATAASLIDGAEALRNRINELGILPSITDVDSGSYNATSATSSAFSASADLLSSDAIYGCTDYYQAMRNILLEYVDGQVLVVFARHFGVSGTSKSQIRSALTSHFPQSWWTDTQNGSPPAEMITAITEVKDELIPYLDVYNEIMAASGTAAYRVLASETITDGSTEYDVTGYRHTVTDGSNLDSSMSYIAQAVYSYLYSAQTGESKDEEVTLENIDLTGGALKLIANATTQNGNVVFEGEAELTTLGYYILAAGATYDPFVSVAGNDTYIQVIDQFVKQSDQKDQVIQVLQTAINTRKPIYVTDAGRSDWASMEDVTEISTASYRIARLSDLLSIGENTARAYAVIKGNIRPSSVDSSTWEYVQGGASTSSSSSSDNTTTEVNTATTGGMVTVGTDELLASDTVMSLPIAFTCGSDSLIMTGLTNKRGAVQTIGGLTSVILNNAALDNKGDTHIENKDTEMIFLNGLGDIVLSDGTIVLPAISNPILYEYTAQGGEDETSSSWGYYPYTATMLNHYPALRVSADKKAYVSSTNNVGKYVLSKNDNSLEAVKIYGVTSSDQMQTGITDRIRVALMGVNSFSVESDVTSVRQPMNYYAADTGNLRQFLGYVFDRPEYLVYSPQQNGEGIPLFPLNYDSADMQQSYLALAGPIVTSAVRYVSTADASSASVRTSSGRFRVESFIEDFAAQGMMGNQYSETMVKNYQLSYEQLVDDQYGRLTRLIQDLTSDAVATLGRIDGVLAIKNGYESGFFNLIMDFIQRAYLLIAVVLFIVIAVKFLRGHYSLFYVALIGALVFASFQVYAVWMPTAVPAAYNFFVNDIIEDVVWNTVTVKSEDYENTYRDSSRVDAQTGAPRPYTATITLYKMTQTEMESIAEQAAVPETDIRTGTPVFLDEDAGIFVQGDAIKMSIDKLLANNAMRGLYQSQWEQVDAGAADSEIEPIDVQGNGNPYIIKLTNPYVSLESYYTPFCQFERAFLVNLNNFSNIFRVDRQTYRYDNYVYKDAFLFNAFTNSAIFTSPNDAENDYANLRLNIREDTILGDRTATVEDIIALCEQHMQPFEDWLNLRSVFYQPSDAMKQSLWGQMLLRQDYYSNDWTMTPEQEENVSDLIRYINDQTKQFVIRNSKQLNFCSDENAIKLVSLYATTCFTHRVSEIGYWMYPNYVNASDIELADVLYGAMTSLEDRNSATDGDVVNTVTLHLGAWGAILVLLITVTSAIFIFILTYLVPVLYALFGIILVYKLINSEQSIGVVKGYVKVTLVTVLLYLAYSFGLKLVGMFGYAWYGYLGCLLVTLLCIYFLFFVCLAVVTNPLELGNDTLARNLFGALDRLTGHRLSRLTSNSLHIHSRNSYGVGYNQGIRAYAHGASIDDRYSGRRPRRGEHYGRWSDFDDDDMSARARVISRFGRLGYADEVGRTRTGFRHTRLMRGVHNATGAVRNSANTVNQVGFGIRTNLSERFSNSRRR